MIRAADERGNNEYLDWRKRKKSVMLTFAKNSDETQERRELKNFMQYTWKYLYEIQADKTVIDNRDPYREGGEHTINVL